MNDENIRSHFCIARGTKVHYLERNDENPIQTLILLHSFAAGAFLWQEWMATSNFKGRIIAPDLPGNGKSSLPNENPDLNYYIHFLKDFCKETNVSHFIGLGVSMGSNILAAFALDSPQMMDRLILTSPTDDTAQPNILRKIARLPVLGEWIAQLFPHSKTTLRNQISKNFYDPQHLNEQIVTHWWSSFETGSVRAWIPKALRAGPSTIAWHNIRVPAIVVFGKNDPVIKQQFKIRLQSAMTRAEFLELESCGHYPHLEFPKKMHEILLKFTTGT